MVAVQQAHNVFQRISVTEYSMLLTKGFTSAGLTGQAIELLFSNVAFVLGSTERYSTREFVCNSLSLINTSSKQDVKSRPANVKPWTLHAIQMQTT
jgi:hypothetical protein